jgi:hypothetical protein
LVIPLVVGAALGGQLLTKFSYRVVAVTGILISIVGMVGLSELSASTPLWDFAFGFLPVGGVVLPLIPLGFGIGLTFPVFLLAAQNQVSKDDVGEAGGLIQFLQSLGGAIGLSMLASFQATRFKALAPAVPSLASTETAILTSYDQTFEVMLGLLVVALLFAVFLKGRLPKGPSSTGVPPP